MKPTETFEQGTVVRVPFPYTDKDHRQHRPALVVSDGGLGPAEGLLWVVMITSLLNRGWPGDVPLGDDYQTAGLPVPSLVRTTKVATIEARHAERIGALTASRNKEVMAMVRAHLGIGSP